MLHHWIGDSVILPSICKQNLPVHAFVHRICRKKHNLWDIDDQLGKIPLTTAVSTGENTACLAQEGAVPNLDYLEIQVLHGVFQ